MPETVQPTAAAYDNSIGDNQRAEELIAAQDLAGAARVLVGIIEHDSGDFRAYNNMGIIAWMQDAWEDAYTMFKKSVTIKPDYADALINLFDAALKLKRIPQVKSLFEKAAALLKDSDELQLIVKSIQEQGEAIYLTPRAQAVGIYNPLIKEAHTLLEDGQLYKAMETYLRAHDQEGPNSEIFSGLGIISYYQKRYEDAYTLFAESIKLCPYDPDAYLNLLDAAKESCKLSDAKEIYEHYAKDIPALAAVAEHFQNI